jgi:polysaccharide biosynthesis/export protein
MNLQVLSTYRVAAGFLFTVAFSLFGTSLFAQTVQLANGVPADQQWFEVGTVKHACANCAAPANGPKLVGTPTQPVGLTSGACQPCIRGIDCTDRHNGIEPSWKDAHPIDFQPLLHGEYVGPVRLPATTDYRVRVGDELQFIFLFTREPTSEEYRLQVGDEISIESVVDPTLNRGSVERGVQVQPDGRIHSKLVGAIPAAGKTTAELRKTLEKSYSSYLKNPAVDVLPVKTNTRLLDLQNSVDSRFNQGGGFARDAVVSPDGRIVLPLISEVYVQGMTLQEIRHEVNLRYAEQIYGVQVEPRLSRQAPHFVYVYGEVRNPSQVRIEGPVTVAQALAMAGGPINGANLRQVVIFRQAEDWRIMSTMLDLRGMHLGKKPAPSDMIWVRDNDLIVVPPTPIKVFDNFVEQVFTRGVYGIVPFGGISVSFGQQTFLTP